MGELGWVYLEHLVQEQMLWDRRQPLLSSDNMGDSHEIVVNHIRQMVGWVTISLHDDLVIYSVIVKDHLSMDQILVFSLSSWDQHPYDVWHPFFFLLLDLLFGQPVAESIILSLRVFGIALKFAHLLQSFSCAKAVVCISIFEQSLCEFFIHLKSL